MRSRAGETYDEFKSKLNDLAYRQSAYYGKTIAVMMGSRGGDMRAWALDKFTEKSGAWGAERHELPSSEDPAKGARTS